MSRPRTLPDGVVFDLTLNAAMDRIVLRLSEPTDLLSLTARQADELGGRLLQWAACSRQYEASRTIPQP